MSDESDAIDWSKHVGSCRMFYAERRCTCVGRAALDYLDGLILKSTNPTLLRAARAVRDELLSEATSPSGVQP